MEDLTDEPEDITLTEFPADKNEDPIEGTSTSQIDESSNDAATSSGKISDPSAPLKCGNCMEIAVLTVYKQRQQPNGGKIEDIFKNYCNKCETHFGMCSKKVRGAYSYVTEEGRILSIAEKLEFFRAEKRKRSTSRPIVSETAPPEPTASSSESSTSCKDNSEEKYEEEGIEDLEEAPEGSEDVTAAPESSGAPQAPPRERAPRKKAKKHAFGGKRPKTNWSASRKKKSTADSAAPIRRVTPPKRAEPKVKKEEPKKGRGRPAVKLTPLKDTPSTSTPNSSIFIPKIPVKCIKTADSGAQTDMDMLLKSTYLKDAFNETMREGLGEQIATRLEDQPLMLRKQFLLMLKTIQSQAKEIAIFKELEQRYKKAVEHLQEFGRATRLNFSDELRSLREDMVERKKEFQAHETEMISMFIREKAKYESYKEQMNRKYEDQQLEYSLLEAKFEHLEQENVYEKERAEYYLQQMDRAKNKIYSAEERAESSEKKLKDRLFLANNERCAGCDARESIRAKLIGECADMKVELENAKTDREEAVKKAALFEAAAQNLGRDCDAIKYESNTWKTFAERYKKDVQKLQQTVKDREKELADKAAETPKSITTPKSIALTPIYTERITPPEDGEFPATPPQGSSTPKPAEKPLVQKVIEKKIPPPIATGFESWIPKEKLNAPPPEIPKAVSAFGVPIKQKETEKPAKIAPSTQPLPWEKMAETTKAITSDSLSEALAKAQADSFAGGGANFPIHASKAYLEEMNRMSNSRKRNVVEEGEKKSTPPSSSSPAPLPKKTKPAGSSTPLPLPTNAPVAVAAATPKYIPPASSGASTPSQKPQGPSVNINSLSNLRKIPKLSEKPPQPEFAPALGLTDKEKSVELGIPGLGMDKLDEKTKEKEREELMRIQPAKPVIQKPVEKTQNPNPIQNPPTPKVTKSLPNLPQNHQNPTKNHSISPQKKKNNKKRADWIQRKNVDNNSPPMNPWRQPPQQQQQQQYGIQTNQPRGFPMDMGLDRPWSDSGPLMQRNGGGINGGGPGRPTESFSSLPWHRDNRDNRGPPAIQMQDTPFGKVPIQDFAQRHMQFRPSPQQQQQHAPPPFYTPQRDNNNFYSSRDFSPPNPQQSRMFSPPPFGYSSQPPNNGNPRSFYS